MSFRNLQVDVEDLPDADRVDFRPLAPSYAREVTVQWVLAWASIFLALTVPAIFVWTPLAGKLVSKLPALRLVTALLPPASLVAALVLVPLAARRARVAGYALREHDIAYRYGLFFRKVVVLPFNRVQHAEVSTGPLQRRYGLASLKLYTAGASDVDLRIDGLTQELAEKLRDHVTQRTGGPHGG